MAMNFFESQEQARRNTGRLVALFAAGVLSIIVMTYFLIVSLFFVAAAKSEGSVATPSLWVPEVLMGSCAFVLLLVGGGYLYKLNQLRHGGKSVALSLGGRVIYGDTTDLHERKVLNVVEEMAIASGVPTPPVYMMGDENGINAFAAGYSPTDCVIGVTRGCIEHLSRDELQGVMAHEFSHILNGDMRLNIRLIAILNGVLVMGIVGYYVMRSAAMGRRGGKNNGAAAILLTGLGLMAIGFLGTLCGRMIKMAVSRQREFLADASAVQFTRNPEGLAGALKSIGRQSGRAVLASPNAASASHMLFADGIKAFSGKLMATHPPLEDRIKRIDPSWGGDWGEEPDDLVLEQDAVEEDDDARRKLAQTIGTVAAVMTAAEAGGPASSTPPPLPASAIDSIGVLTPEHVSYAQELLALIPAELKEASREAYSARAVMYAILINEEEEVRTRQLEQLDAHADAAVYGVTQALLPLADSLDPRVTLALIDLCTASLRTMSGTQYMDFKANVDFLIKADDQIDLFEWTVLRILDHSLESSFVDAKPVRTDYYSVASVLEPCSVLLSTVARVGAASEEEIQESFSVGVTHFGDDRVSCLGLEACGLDPLEGALDELMKCAAPIKKKVLSACAATIAADNQVTQHEGELLRAISESLDCPMPPLLPGQALV